MLEWLNRFSKSIFIVIYEYIATSFSLILRPRTTLRSLWNGNGNINITSSLYFFISIAILHMASFAAYKTGIKYGIHYNVAVDNGFEIPILGNVGFSFVFNFIGFFIGAVLILFLLVNLIENGFMHFYEIKAVVLYSVVILIVFKFFEDFIYNMILVFFLFVLDMDLSFINSVKTMSVLENLDNIIDLICILFCVEASYSYVFLIIYFGYIFYLIGNFISYKLIRRWLLSLTLILVIFIVGTSRLVCYSVLYSELIKIDECINNIKMYSCSLAETKACNHGFKDVFHYKSLQDEYLSLSNNRLLSGKDRVAAYKIYLCIKHQEFFPEIKKEIYTSILFNESVTSYGDNNFDNALKSKLNSSKDLQKLCEIEELVKEEYKYKNKSSFDTFLYKFNELYRQENIENIIMGSFIRIIP